jgi:hypothetical protein
MEASKLKAYLAFGLDVPFGSKDGDADCDKDRDRDRNEDEDEDEDEDEESLPCNSDPLWLLDSSPF